MALGRLGGYLCGIGVLIEYIIAPAAVATAIGAYINVLEPSIPTVASATVVYIIFTVIHLIGVGASLKLELLFTIVATAVLILFFIVGLPHVTMDNLNQVGGGQILPNGLGGLWSTLPLAAWFFLALEGLPMAAEEARNPAKDMPRALISSFFTLGIVGVLTLTVAAGLGGAEVVGNADAPLPEAVKAGLGSSHWLFGIVSAIGLAGLLASFHGIVMAYSRQTFALARAGYLPAFLSRVNKRSTPTWALIVPGIIGIGLVIMGSLLPGSAIPILVTMSVFGAAISYILMMVSALILRRKYPNMNRPFRVPGGRVTACIALLFSLILLPAGVKDYPIAMLFGSLIFLAFILYYFAFSRHRVQEQSFEEELELIQQSESELR
jgi:ethanolamine permease